jgi:hypothetical protein
VLLLLAWCAGLAGCGNPTVKAAGEACVASSECGEGLVCDLGHSPAVCAGMLSLDAAAPVVDAAATDAAMIDAAMIDARIDAAVDAPVDAPIDADIDAAAGP